MYLHYLSSYSVAPGGPEFETPQSPSLPEQSSRLSVGSGECGRAGLTPVVVSGGSHLTAFAVDAPCSPFLSFGEASST